MLQGEVADPANTPPGCHFNPRCSYAQAICREKSPVLEEIAPNHFVSCHRARELTLRGVDMPVARTGLAAQGSTMQRSRDASIDATSIAGRSQ